MAIVAHEDGRTCNARDLGSFIYEIRWLVDSDKYDGVVRVWYGGVTRKLTSDHVSNFPIHKVSFAEVRCMYQNSVLCSQINQMFHTLLSLTRILLKKVLFVVVFVNRKCYYYTIFCH